MQSYKKKAHNTKCFAVFRERNVFFELIPTLVVVVLHVAAHAIVVHIVLGGWVEAAHVVGFAGGWLYAARSTCGRSAIVRACRSCLARCGRVAWLVVAAVCRLHNGTEVRLVRRSRVVTPTVAAQ